MVATRTVRDVSPLPPGRYWTTLVGQILIDEFGEWVKDMRGAARVETVQQPDDTAEPTLFAIFVVPAGRAPFWPAEKFGFPNEAPPEVTQLSDVERAPEIETPGLPDFKRVSENLFGDLTLLAVVLFIAILSKQSRRERSAYA